MTNNPYLSLEGSEDDQPAVEMPALSDVEQPQPQQESTSTSELTHHEPKTGE